MKLEDKNKIIEDTRAKYGQVYEASPNALPDVFVLYIKPTRNVYRQYRIDQGDPAYEFSAQERLCEGCIVYPEKKLVPQLWEDYPAFPTALASSLLLAAGGGPVTTKSPTTL